MMEYISLIRHELIHLLLTFLAFTITVLFFLRKNRDRNYIRIVFVTIGAILGGFLVDADHLFDYILVFGTAFHPDYFFSGLMFGLSQKMYVPFHGWEWIILLGVFSYLMKNKLCKYFLVALAVGLLSHLVFDAHANHISFLGYSFIYRLLYNFDLPYFNA